MKHICNLWIVALLAPLFVACEQSDTTLNEGLEQPIVTLSATIQNEPTSRTELGEPTTSEGKTTYPVLWSAGDRLAVMQGESLFEFTLSGTAGEEQGLFVCTSSNAAEFDPAAALQAFYPYEWVTPSGSSFRYATPDTQVWQSDSFGTGAAPMGGYRAAGDTEPLQLKNLFGVFKLQLTGAGEKIVSVELTCHQAISGAGSMSFDTESGNHALTLTGSGQGEKYLRLDCGAGVSLQSEATEFLLLLPATVAEKGHHLTVIITDSEGHKRIVRTNEAKQIAAGRILKMPVLCYTPQSGEYIEVQEGKNCYFGQGIQIGDQVWAPINCGYKPASATSKGHQYGRYYQWGRKYGQGYYGDCDLDESWEDPHMVEGLPNSLDYAQSEEQRNTYFCCIYTGDGYENNGDWLVGDPNHLLWTKPKTEYDPCPSGWRVPDQDEMDVLIANYSDWTAHQAQLGRWFSGATAIEAAGAGKVFLPASGWVDGGFATDREPNVFAYSAASGRDFEAIYWTATGISGEGRCSYEMKFQKKSSSIKTSEWSRSTGASVRCIKE